MMTKRLAAAVAAFLLSTGVASPASAASMIYTLSGTFYDRSDASALPRTATRFTGLGDTGTAYKRTSFGSTITVMPLTSLVASSGDVVFNFMTPISFIVTSDANFAGFASQDFSRYLVRFFGTAPGAFNGYDQPSTLAPTPARFVTDDFTGAFATDRGDVRINFFADNLVLSAAAGAVPEPEAWAMMLLGFGAVGAAMRRRAAVKTIVTYA